ncbi:MAG: DUF4291 domain-containing protein [Aggregatilineales bacterium]
MALVTESYASRKALLPASGQHIIAQFDEQSVIVYQAYKPEIASHAIDYQQFAGAPDFNLHRMTWIKPGFLWMMHRSGWATKPDQERILAVRLDRVGFDAILRKAVHSTFQPQLYEHEATWKAALGSSAVRLQWDPDYSPADGRLERRAIQIGLGGKTAKHYANGGWIIDIEDITDFVIQQRQYTKSPYTDLLLPIERVYPVFSAQIAEHLGVTL